MNRLALMTVLSAALLLAGSGAQAHTGDRVFSTWTVDGADVTAAMRVPARLAVPYDGGPDGSPEAALARHFLRTVHLSLGDSKCTPGRAPLVRVSTDGVAVMDFFWRCAAAAGAGQTKLTLRVDSLFEHVPGHVHFARFRLPGGHMDEGVLTRGNRLHTVELRGGATGGERSWIGATARYVGLGFSHIIAGADHLAFVLALMLAASSLRAMLFVITGFTLGHSLTLALAATGAAAPVPAVIEALIGFTVAIAAAEGAGRISGRALSLPAVMLPLAGLAVAAAVFGSALPAVTWAGLLLFSASYMALARREQGWRWAAALATAFGLVHGFGFAGVLQETGLPEERLIPALLGFNLGVEAGQLAAVALVLALAASARRLMPDGMRAWAAQGAAAALCGLGTFWFVSRAFAG